MRLIRSIFVAGCLMLSAYLTADELSIDGYDPVAYFTDGVAVRGSVDFAAEYNDKVWWFRSDEHRQRFLSAPETYMPAYGGHCANGLSDGHVVRANPEIYRIIDGQLYLFYSWWGKAQWAVNQQEQIQLADRNWQIFSTTGELAEP